MSFQAYQGKILETIPAASIGKPIEKLKEWVANAMPAYII